MPNIEGLNFMYLYNYDPPADTPVLTFAFDDFISQVRERGIEGRDQTILVEIVLVSDLQHGEIEVNANLYYPAGDKMFFALLDVRTERIVDLWPLLDVKLGERLALGDKGKW